MRRGNLTESTQTRATTCSISSLSRQSMGGSHRRQGHILVAWTTGRVAPRYRGTTAVPAGTECNRFSMQRRRHIIRTGRVTAEASGIQESSTRRCTGSSCPSPTKRVSRPGSRTQIRPSASPRPGDLEDPQISPSSSTKERRATPETTASITDNFGRNRSHSSRGASRRKVKGKNGSR